MVYLALRSPTDLDSACTYGFVSRLALALERGFPRSTERVGKKAVLFVRPPPALGSAGGGVAPAACRRCGRRGGAGKSRVPAAPHRPGRALPAPANRGRSWASGGSGSQGEGPEPRPLGAGLGAAPGQAEQPSREGALRSPPSGAFAELQPLSTHSTCSTGSHKRVLAARASKPLDDRGDGTWAHWTANYGI